MISEKARRKGWKKEKNYFRGELNIEHIWNISKNTEGKHNEHKWINSENIFYQKLTFLIGFDPVFVVGKVNEQRERFIADSIPKAYDANLFTLENERASAITLQS